MWDGRSGGWGLGCLRAAMLYLFATLGFHKNSDQKRIQRLQLTNHSTSQPTNPNQKPVETNKPKGAFDTKLAYHGTKPHCGVRQRLLA